MKRLTTKECLEFLYKIESGEITLSFNRDLVVKDYDYSSYIRVPKGIRHLFDNPRTIYAGNCHYKASNNWIIVVFNDCNSWDHINKIISYDGRSIEFSQMEYMLRHYTVSDEVAKRCYDIG